MKFSRFWCAGCLLAVMMGFSSGKAQEDSSSKNLASEQQQTASQQASQSSDEETTKEDVEAEETTAEVEKDEVPSWDFNEVVVTPSLRQGKKFHEPYLIYSMSEEDLQNRRMVRTLPEALEETPGVMVQKTSHGQGSPFIRGYTGFRTLLLIDGIRLNNSVFRDGPNEYWNTVDYYSIERLEVLKGPGSSLYGSDAVGGVVQAVTREREYYDKEIGLTPRVYYRYASGENSHSSRVEMGGNLNDELGVLAGFYYKDFGDIRAGGGQNELPKTGYFELGGDLKLNWYLSDTAELVFGYYIVDQHDAERTHKTIFSKSFRGTEIGDERRRRLDHTRQLAYAKLKLYDLDAAIQKATFTASWHYQKERQDRIRADFRRDVQGFIVNTVGLQAHFESVVPWGNLVYGVDYYRDFVSSFREDFNADGTLNRRRIQGPIADDATYDLLGIFVQNEIFLGEQLTVFASLRYTHAWVDADEIEDPTTGNEVALSDNWGSFTGSLRMIYYFTENWNMFAGVGQSFRTPNLSDLTRFDTARSNEFETPVRELDPEYFLTYEVGLKTNYERGYAQFSYFYTQVFNQIIRFPTGNVIGGDVEVTKDNEGDGYVHGLEFHGAFNFTPEWQIFAGASWLEGIVSTFPQADGDKEDEVLDRLQPAQGFVGLRWTHSSGRYWAEGVVHLVRTQDRLSTRDQQDTQRIPPDGTPGYVLGTIRAGAEVTDYASITAALENITNENYRVHGSGQNEPGINFVVGVELGY